MKDTDVVRFDYKTLGGNGKVQVTVRLGDEVLDMDKLDITSAAARERFAKRLCKGRSGIDRAGVDRELLSTAEEVQAAERRESAPAESASELDVSRIVRPERFITPEVSGLTVATPTLRDGRPAGRWMLYLRWADGKREAMELPDSILLPDGSKLWIHPMLGEPGMKETPAWTEKARRAWQAGAESPDPADVFKRLCQCIAYYIDFPQDCAADTTATLALWVVLTYCYPAWSAIPYLYLGGPGRVRQDARLRGVLPAGLPPAAVVEPLGGGAVPHAAHQGRDAAVRRGRAAEGFDAGNRRDQLHAAGRIQARREGHAA